MGTIFLCKFIVTLFLIVSFSFFYNFLNNFCDDFFDKFFWGWIFWRNFMIIFWDMCTMWSSDGFTNLVLTNPELFSSTFFSKMIYVYRKRQNIFRKIQFRIHENKILETISWDIQILKLLKIMFKVSDWKSYLMCWISKYYLIFILIFFSMYNTGKMRQATGERQLLEILCSIWKFIIRRISNSFSYEIL